VPSALESFGRGIITLCQTSAAGELHTNKAKFVAAASNVLSELQGFNTCTAEDFHNPRKVQKKLNAHVDEWSKLSKNCPKVCNFQKRNGGLVPRAWRLRMMPNAQSTFIRPSKLVPTPVLQQLDGMAEDQFVALLNEPSLSSFCEALDATNVKGLGPLCGIKLANALQIAFGCCCRADTSESEM
jgi:hypothetical protein